MTRVNGSGPGPAGQGGTGSPPDHSFQTRQQLDPRAAGFEAKKRFDGKPSTPAGSADRAAAFQRSIRAAETKGKDEAAAHAAEPKDGPILAVSGWVAEGTPSLDPHAAAPGQVEAPSALEPVVADILARIEQALRVELSASAAGPMSLQIDLGGAIEGLKTLTVTMTDTSLDVTLFRGGGEASAELVLAAQALADRLHQRSGKRIVRVLDAASDDATVETETPGGIQALSRILGNLAAKS